MDGPSSYWGALKGCTTFPSIVDASVDCFRLCLLARASWRELTNWQHLGIENVTKTSQAFLTAGPNDALWCILLLHMSPPKEAQELLELVVSTLASSVQVPTGLRLKNSRFGNSHILKGRASELQDVALTATRVLVLVLEKWLSEHSSSTEPKDEERREVFKALLKSQLVCNEPANVILAAKTTAVGIPVDIFAASPSLILQNIRFSAYFVGTFFQRLAESLGLFFEKRKEIYKQEADLARLREVLDDSEHEWGVALYEVTEQDDEEYLPVPLSFYLKDSEVLNGAYLKRSAARADVEVCSEQLKKVTMLCGQLAQCCRLLFVLSSIMTHTLVFERTLEIGQGAEEEEAARQTLIGYDWDRVLTFGLFERRVYTTILSRLFMTCAARCFPELQDIFARDGVLENAYDSDDEGTPILCPLHLALKDLCSPHLSWYAQVQQPQVQVQEGRDDLLSNMPLLLPSLDTRIATSLCYWGVHYNFPAQSALLGWRGGKDKSSLYWLQLVRMAVLQHSNNTHISLQNCDYDDDDDDEQQQQQDNNKDASVIAYLRTARPVEEVEEENGRCSIYETAKLVESAVVCGFYAENQALLMADALLTFSGMEGSGLIHRRGLHPLDVLLPLQSSPLFAFSEDAWVECATSLIALARQEGQKRGKERDELCLLAALNLLSVLVQGASPPFRCPSQAPTFQHLRFIPGVGVPPVKSVLSTLGTSVDFLSQLCALQFIYAGETSNLLPIGPSNRSAFGTALELLTAFSLLDNTATGAVEKALLSAAESTTSINWSIAEKFSKIENPDDKVLLPFLLAVGGGTTQVLKFLFESLAPASVVWDDAVWAAADLGVPLLRRTSLTFLAAMVASCPVLNGMISRRENYLSGVVASHLSTLQTSWPSLSLSSRPETSLSEWRAVIDVANQMLIFALTLIRDAKKQNESASSYYQTVQNVFLLEFAFEGNGIVSAKDLYVFACRGLLVELSSTAVAHNSWQRFLLTILTTTLRDTVLFTLELFFEMCVRRPEVQDAIHQFCRDVVTYLPSHLKAGNEERKSDGCYIATADLCCRFSTVLCTRNDACQELVLTSGCVEGMMTALSLCSSSDQMDRVTERLSESVIAAIQELVLRSQSAWKYVQDCSGIEGLLQLCALGNTTIKNLCCTTLMDKAADWDLPEYGNEVTKKGGIPVFALLLDAKEAESTYICCLRLLYTLCINSAEFRKESFARSGAVLFFAVFALLRRCKEESIRILICNLLSGYGAENPVLLRRIMQKEKEAMDIIVEISSSAGNRVLTTAAVSALACMTTFDDSEYPTGTAYLRQALQTSGTLPSLR